MSDLRPLCTVQFFWPSLIGGSHLLYSLKYTDLIYVFLINVWINVWNSPSNLHVGFTTQQQLFVRLATRSFPRGTNSLRGDTPLSPLSSLNRRNSIFAILFRNCCQNRGGERLGSSLSYYRSIFRSLLDLLARASSILSFQTQFLLFLFCVSCHVQSTWVKWAREISS